MAEKRYRTVLLAVSIVLLMTFGVFSGCRKEESAEFTGFSMDTVISVKLYGGNSPDSVLQDVSGIFTETEQVLSRHIESSPVSALNRGETVAGEKWFITLLSKNLYLSEETDGLFDPTVGPLIDLWSIGSGNEKVPSEEALADALSHVSYERIHVSSENITIEPGTVLDLGASGKGAVLDRVRDFLCGTDTKGAVVSAGGSILLYGSKNGSRDFTVAVRLPDGGTSDYLGVLTLQETCVSTSGSYERYFTEDGVRYHHILSPESGFPAETGLVSVTVVYPDGTMSDLLSTAVFLLGEEEGLKLLYGHQAEGVLVTEDGRVIVTEGLKDRFRLTEEGYTLEVYEGIR